MFGTNASHLIFSSSFATILTYVEGLFALIWGVHLLDSLLLKRYFRGRFCVMPRQEFGFGRILLSPFIHLDRSHLIVNTIPLLVFGGIVASLAETVFWQATMIIILFGGFGVYIFGPINSRHVGASGLILGYFSFLLFMGLFSLNWLLIILSVVIGLLFSVFMFGVLFNKGPHISVSGHWSGFAGGIAAAYIVAAPFY